MKTLLRRRATRFLLALLLLFSIPLPAEPKDDAAKEQELLENTQKVADGKLSLKGPSGDTWLIAAWEYVRDHSVKGWNWLSKHVHDVLTEDFQILNTSFLGSTILVGVLTLMMLSGAWAASIAQSRRHPRVKFFAFGFFTFFVGPYRLLLNLDIKGEKEMLERLAQEAAAKKAEKEERERLQMQGQKEKGFEAPAVSSEGVAWNQNYFNSIQRRPDGTPDGPWEVTYNNVHVRVLEILEVLPNLVAVRLVNQEGHEMRGRIPFAKIEQWDRAEGAQQ